MLKKSRNSTVQWNSDTHIVFSKERLPRQDIDLCTMRYQKNNRNWMLSPFRWRRLKESFDCCWVGLTSTCQHQNDCDFLKLSQRARGRGFAAHSFFMSSFLWQTADLFSSHFRIFVAALDSCFNLDSKFRLSRPYPATTQPSHPYSTNCPVAVSLASLISLSRWVLFRKAARQITTCCGNAFLPCAKLPSGRLVP